MATSRMRQVFKFYVYLLLYELYNLATGPNPTYVNEHGRRAKENCFQIVFGALLFHIQIEHVHTHAYAHAHVQMHTHIHMHIHIYTHINIHTHIHTHTHNNNKYSKC